MNNIYIYIGFLFREICMSTTCSPPPPSKRTVSSDGKFRGQCKQFSGNLCKQCVGRTGKTTTFRRAAVRETCASHMQGFQVSPPPETPPKHHCSMEPER